MGTSNDCFELIRVLYEQSWPLMRESRLKFCNVKFVWHPASLEIPILIVSAAICQTRLNSWKAIAVTASHWKNQGMWVIVLYQVIYS